tara:strand:+ start:957 stop:3167 length:2211 start_codon:yes stop_codon:yes gene_type:complete
MRDHRNYSTNDDPQIPDGDNGFIGVNMRTSPHLLQPGYVSLAKNARFRNGIAEPRKGTFPVTWTNVTNALEWPIEWNQGDINWEQNIQGNFGKVFGIGVWNDPMGSDWILVASSTDNSTIQIYRVRPGNNAVQVKCSVPLTVPETLYQDTNTEDAYWFSQAFDKCILSRGDSLSHLVLSDFEIGFVEAPQASGSGGTENIPNSKTTLSFQNRLLVPHKPVGGYKADHVAVSDILSYTEYDPVYASFKINQGDSDNIQRLYPFNDQTVVVFKDTSIYAVSGLIGDWSANATLDLVTTEYGLVGPRSIANTGSDLWFLSARGVVSLRQTEQNKLQGVSEPVSTPMQPVIDRIDMPIANKTACAAYWQNRYYLSVPLDGSQKNNAVLVYDFVNKAWAGYDEGSAIRIKYFFVADHHGSEQLFFVDYEGVVGLYEYGETESTRTDQTSFSCDVVLTAQPSIGNTIQVNNGTRVVGSRLSKLEESGGDLLSDGTNNFVEDPQTNSLENDSTWDMGEESGEHCGTPADNLWQGYTTEGWEHSTEAVYQLDCGVRFVDPNPMLVRASDPYVKVTCTKSNMAQDIPIEFEVVSRGYGFNSNRKRFQEARVFISTWDPKYKVTGIVDGVNEETVLLDDTSFTFPDRQKFLTFATEDWPLTNVNDDHENRGKEDYSVVLDTSLGGGTSLGSSGLVLDLHQHYTHKLRVDQRGSFFQIKLQGLEGRIRIHSIAAGSSQGQRREGQHT